LRNLYIRPGRSSYYDQFLATKVLTGYPSQLLNPYSEQWTFGVERQLMTDWVLAVDYIGSHTLKINRPLDIDPPAPFIRTAAGQVRSPQAANCTRPYWIWWYGQNKMTCNAARATNPQPPYSVIQTDVNNGYGYYDALDINLSRRLSQRLFLLASYTWSHAINNVDPDIPRMARKLDLHWDLSELSFRAAPAKLNENNRALRTRDPERRGGRNQRAVEAVERSDPERAGGSQSGGIVSPGGGDRPGTLVNEPDARAPFRSGGLRNDQRAGIDVPQKRLAVVVAEVASEGEYDFQRRPLGARPDELRPRADWLIEQPVQEVVLESTAPYGPPVWPVRERYGKAACRGGRALAPGPDRCSSRTPHPIAARAGASRTSSRPNASASAWWRQNWF
jgi:hypothetical protein